MACTCSSFERWLKTGRDRTKRARLTVGPPFFSSFIISHRMKLFVFSTSKLIKRTDKLVLIRQRSHAPTRRQLRTKKRRLFIIRWRSSTKRHFRMKKRIPKSVENKKMVERKNYFLAGKQYCSDNLIYYYIIDRGIWFEHAL